jgi:hypothetical protein
MYIVVVYCPRLVLQTTSSIPPDHSDLRRPFPVFFAAVIPKFAELAFDVESTMGIQNQVLIEDDQGGRKEKGQKSYRKLKQKRLNSPLSNEIKTDGGCGKKRGSSLSADRLTEGG